MSETKKHSLFRIYAFSTTVSLALIVFAGIQTGLTGLFLVLALAALEVSLSFDNAVVNARILKRMSPGWQQAFLTIGILIAVFGVRIILPIILVAVAIGQSLGAVVDLALHHPTEYGHQLENAHPMIAAFGGVFLLMIFAEYFFEERKIHWIGPLERILQKVGKLKNIGPIMAVSAIIIASRLVEEGDQQTVLLAGLAGLLVFMVIHSLDDLLRKTGIEKNLERGSAAAMTFKAGLLGFIYLEIIDASFSLDGVIGAFAITNQVLLIAIGLGIGALYVRTITVHMLRRGVLDEYRYIEQGAHYAVGVLGAIMITSLAFKVPEVITGLAGLTIISIAVFHSIKARKKDHRLAAEHTDRMA